MPEPEKKPTGKRKRGRGLRKLDTANRKTIMTTQKQGARVVLTFKEAARIRLNIPDSVDIAIEK